MPNIPPIRIRQCKSAEEHPSSPPPSQCSSAASGNQSPAAAAQSGSLGALASSDRQAFYFDQAPNTEPTAVFHHKRGQTNGFGMIAETAAAAPPITPAARLSHSAEQEMHQLHGIRLHLADSAQHSATAVDSWDCNNHRIYSIDELSEVSGRSEAIVANERAQLERVELIRGHQRQQAREVRPVSRRGTSQTQTVSTSGQRDYKVLKPPPSPSDSPHYGYVESPPPTASTDRCLPAGCPRMHKCRIVIPNMAGSESGRGAAAQSFEAFIFDLDLSQTGRSSLSASQTASHPRSHPTTSQLPTTTHPSMRSSNRTTLATTTGRQSELSALETCGCSQVHGRQQQSQPEERSRDHRHRIQNQLGSGFHQQQHHHHRHHQCQHHHQQHAPLTRSQAVPAKTDASCCGCFGLGSNSKAKKKAVGCAGGVTGGGGRADGGADDATQRSNRKPPRNGCRGSKDNGSRDYLL